MKKAIAAAALGMSAAGLMACTPSVNVNVNLAPIYAKLDVNFHIKGYFDPPQKQKATISLFDYLNGSWMTKPIKLPSNTPIELYLDVPVNLDSILNDLSALNGKPVVTVTPPAQ